MFFYSFPLYSPISVFHTLHTSQSTCIQFHIMYPILQKKVFFSTDMVCHMIFHIFLYSDIFITLNEYFSHRDNYGVFFSGPLPTHTMLAHPFILLAWASRPLPVMLGAPHGMCDYQTSPALTHLQPPEVA